MRVMDGVEATRQLLADNPAAKVVVLTSFSDQPRVADALAAGAVGYLLKDCEPRDLMAAVRAAAQGHAPLDPRVARALLPSGRPARPADELSTREQQVLRLVTKGRGSRGSRSSRASTPPAARRHRDRRVRNAGCPKQPRWRGGQPLFLQVDDELAFMQRRPHEMSWWCGLSQPGYSSVARSWQATAAQIKFRQRHSCR
jgi:hypothetical protein